jgi:hypothetical protein
MPDDGKSERLLDLFSGFSQRLKIFLGVLSVDGQLDANFRALRTRLLNPEETRWNLGERLFVR